MAEIVWLWWFIYLILWIMLAGIDTSNRRRSAKLNSNPSHFHRCNLDSFHTPWIQNCLFICAIWLTPKGSHPLSIPCSWRTRWWPRHLDLVVQGRQSNFNPPRQRMLKYRRCPGWPPPCSPSHQFLTLMGPSTFTSLRIHFPLLQARTTPGSKACHRRSLTRPPATGKNRDDRRRRARSCCSACLRRAHSRRESDAVCTIEGRGRQQPYSERRRTISSREYWPSCGPSSSTQTSNIFQIIVPFYALSYSQRRAHPVWPLTHYAIGWSIGQRSSSNLQPPLWYYWAYLW